MRRPRFVGEFLLGAGLVRADQRLQGRVGFLDQDPAAGFERSDHRDQRASSLWNVHEHQPCVHKIKGTGRRGLRAHIVTQDLKPGVTTVQPLGVDVGCQNMTPGADLLSEPRRNARAPRADLLSEPRRNARAPRADLPDPPA